MKISVIISTYNRPNMLRLVLSAFEQQKLSADISNDDVEIVIADDGSTDNTRKLIDEYKSIVPFKLVHIWHEDDGFRRTMILNKAVAASSGEYLLFLDGDCIPFNDYLVQSVKLAEEKFIVAGNRVLLSPKFSLTLLENDYLQAMEINDWGLFAWLLARMRQRVNKILPWLRLWNGSWRKMQSTNWKRPKGCNFALWKADFIAVNGFDESFTGWGHEDSDLFIRLLHSGVKIKDGRFAVTVLHLWHKESDRANAGENYKRMMQRANDASITQADIGVNQYYQR